MAAMTAQSLDRSRVVYVEWTDSSNTNGWQDSREVSELATGMHELDCWSVGFLIAETDDRVVISSSENPARDAISPLAIPKCAITLMETIREREARS
jgi:hypothetical protein